VPRQDMLTPLAPLRRGSLLRPSSTSIPVTKHILAVIGNGTLWLGVARSFPAILLARAAPEKSRHSNQGSVVWPSAFMRFIARRPRLGRKGWGLPSG
jgi:hypothetical protein